jgi:PAS domain-containing protein
MRASSSTTRTTAARAPLAADVDTSANPTREAKGLAYIGIIWFYDQRPNGSRGVALVNIEAITDSDGYIIGAVNCIQDITERKLAEDAALRLAAIVESSDDAIVSKNLDGIITSWNTGAERIFGYLAEEVIGKPITILNPASS